MIAPRSIALALSRSGRDGNDYHRTEGGAALADMNAEGLTAEGIHYTDRSIADIRSFSQKNLTKSIQG